MGCETWGTKLDAYIDGQLPDEEMRGFDGHVRGCASCSGEALAGLQLKLAVQSAGKRFTPSAEFRRKMERRMAAKPKRSFPPAWAALVAAMVLLVAGALISSYVQKRNSANQMFSEIADLHVATMASASPVDVVSTDRHTVKPWFQGRIPFAFNLPELQNTGFTLEGGRVSYLDQTPGAHLIYDVRKHRISVFIFPEAGVRGGMGDEWPRSEAATFNMKTWTQGGLRYFVVGDAGAADIESLAKLLQGK